MGRKKTPGLVNRGGVWHIDKNIYGRRVCQSTGTDRLEEAERFLARLIEDTRQAEVYGVRLNRTFEQAAARYVMDNQHKRSIRHDVYRIKALLPWIGNERLDRIHMGTLQPWIEHRKKEGVAAGTINHGLKMVRRIVNLAATEWMDEHGLTWLMAAPKVKMLPDNDRRLPYPLTWDEEERLFRELPKHLANMALFAVNTGCRDGEVCSLRWEWEERLPKLNTSVFVIPGRYVKNGDDRLVVLNDIAKSVINDVRGAHPTHVFTFKGKPVLRMMNSAWLRARNATNLSTVRVHDLKHTFGRRLRAAGVCFEDRQDLLGHRSGRITTHYSAAELANLVEAANSVRDFCGNRKPELVVLRRLSVS